MALRNAKEKQFNLGKFVLLVALSSLALFGSLVVTSCQSNMCVDYVTDWHRLIGNANQIKGVTVMIFDGRSSMNVKIDEKGKFDLASVGDYVGAPRTVFVTKKDYLPYVIDVPTSAVNYYFGPLTPLKNLNTGALTGVCYLALADRESDLFGRIGDYKSNAKITARNKDSKYEFASNSDGIFIQQLPEGEYTLEGEYIKPGTKVKILNGKTTIKNIKCGECDKIKRIKR